MVVVRPLPRHAPLLLAVRCCSSETFLKILKRSHAKDSKKIKHVTKKRGNKGGKVGKTREMTAMGWGGESTLGACWWLMGGLLDMGIYDRYTWAWVAWA